MNEAFLLALCVALLFFTQFLVQIQIGNLKWKVCTVMTDIETLNEALDNIANEVDETLAEVAELRASLETEHEDNDDVDLSEAIAKAKAIEARLTGVQESMPTSGDEGTPSDDSSISTDEA